MNVLILIKECGVANVVECIVNGVPANPHDVIDFREADEIEIIALPPQRRKRNTLLC